MKRLDEVIGSDIRGLYYANRVLLPFKAEILKMVIDTKIIMNFSSTSKDAQVSVKDEYTEIYFLDYEDIGDSVTEFENIKLVVVEHGTDIFNLNNHKKIALYLEENHKVRVEKIPDDILFIE